MPKIFQTLPTDCILPLKLKKYLRMKLKSVNVTVLVGDGGNEWAGCGSRLEAVGYLINAVTMGQ